MVAGNEPAVIKPSPDGSILLQASNGEIYGQSITFEPQHQNLGYWRSDDDNAVWTDEHPKAGVAEIASHLPFYPDKVEITRGG